MLRLAASLLAGVLVFGSPAAIAHGRSGSTHLKDRGGAAI
jgi:hypothetical protein